MAYDGWIEYNGTELVNLSRTAQLAEVLGIDTVWTSPSSVQWIEDERGGVDPYNDITEAPWYDPGYPGSVEFAGIVPLAFTGLDDSTLESAPIEYITDGGHSGKPRNSTLSLVANVAIVASTDRGAEYGLRWLNRVLRDSGPRVFCSGADLRYYRWSGGGAPIVHRRDVRLTRGTVVTRKRVTDCASTWLATFTMTAADPYEYGERVDLVANLGGPIPTDAPPLRVNLADRPNVADGAGWDAQVGTNTTKSLETVSPIRGSVSAKFTYTGAASPIGSVFRISPASGALRWNVTPGKWVSVSFDARVSTGTGTRVVQAEMGFYSTPVAGATSDGVAFFDTFDANVPKRIGAILQVPGDAPYMELTGFLGRIDAGTIGTGETTVLDGLIIEEHDSDPGSLPSYFDGDSADGGGFGYDWNGTPGMSTSFQYDLSSVTYPYGSTALVEQSCPVYDYSPVYDPAFPALVPSPTAPNLLPEGWDIFDGMTFDRFWVSIPSVEPSLMNVVPIFTLTSDVDARMVRVSIWPSTADPSDQCDPLFSAVVSYLPAGYNFIIDGEQKASYVWDGLSPAVRRTDSLVYSPSADPVQWTAFTDPTGFLVTVDIFSDSSGVEGDGSVRVSLALVPKSD